MALGDGPKNPRIRVKTGHVKFSLISGRGCPEIVDFGLSLSVLDFKHISISKILVADFNF